MDFDGLGKLLIVGGVALLMTGVLLVLAGRSSFLSHLFQSGTLSLGGGNMTCVVPIVASLVLSVVLTIVLNLLIRFLNK